MFIRESRAYSSRARYVMMDYDIRVEQVEDACALTPGIESPTVSPLHRRAGSRCVDGAARHAQRVMDELCELGARGILVTDIHACRPVSADGPHVPTLRRPHRRWPIVALVLVAAVVVLWVALPGEVQDQFSWYSGSHCSLVFAVMLAALWGLFRTSVRTDDSGLQVINVFKVARVLVGRR